MGECVDTEALQRAMLQIRDSLPTAEEVAERMIHLGRLLDKMEQSEPYRVLMHATGRKIPGDRGYYLHRVSRWVRGLP